jgi:cysteine desulfurase
VEKALAGLPGGNPSSPHAEGRQARAALDQARDRAAVAVGVPASWLVFCSSGTEAINLGILGAGRRMPADRLVATWAAEHQAVLGAVRQLVQEGHSVKVLPVDSAATADAAGIPAGAGLVSIGLANNEVGTLQPVAEVAARARELDALVHLDACQGPRWIRPPLELCDLASISGHKIGAGRGGLLVANPDVRLQPLQYGGPQEWGRRAGREDVEAAVAIATALEVAAATRDARCIAAAPLAARLQTALDDLGGRPTGGAQRLPNYATAAFSRIKGEDLLLALDLLGVAASSGSACASGSLDPSHVLLAMGLSLEEALGSFRLTAGWDTTEKEVAAAVQALQATLPVIATGV